MQGYIGVDVSKATLDLALFCDDNCKATLRISNSEKDINKAIKKFSRIMGSHEFIFGCEATGVYHLRLANHVHGLGYKIKVFNPRMSYHFHKSENITSSTDKVASKVIARLLINYKGPFWEPNEKDVDRLRDSVVRRDEILLDMNRETNRLERFVKDSPALNSILEHIEFLKTSKDTIEKEQRRIVGENPELKKKVDLLTSIPSVGFLTAITFIAKIGDVSRFSKASKVVKFFGINPENQISGISVNKSKMSKKGDKLYRKILYCALLGNIGRDNFLGEYYANLRANGKSHLTAMVALMRKITRLMYTLLRDLEPFSLEKYGCTEKSLTNKNSDVILIDYTTKRKSAMQECNRIGIVVN